MRRFVHDGRLHTFTIRPLRPLDVEAQHGHFAYAPAGRRSSGTAMIPTSTSKWTALETSIGPTPRVRYLTVLTGRQFETWGIPFPALIAISPLADWNESHASNGFAPGEPCHD